MVTTLRPLTPSTSFRRVLRLHLALATSVTAALFVAACGDDSSSFRREANQIRAPQLVVPNRLTPPVRIERIEGAPADWKLAERVAEALRNRDIPAGIDLKSNVAYVLRGQIKITSSSQRDDQLALTWTLFDDKGTKVGDVTQLAAVPKATAGSKMDDVVDAMADAAAESISPIVPSAMLQAKLDTTGEANRSLPRFDAGPKVTELGKQSEKNDSPLSRNLLAPPPHDSVRRPTADVSDPASKAQMSDTARYGLTDKDNTVAQTTGRTLSQNLTGTTTNEPPRRARRADEPPLDLGPIEPNSAQPKSAEPKSPEPKSPEPNSTAQKDTTPRLSLDSRPSLTTPARTPDPTADRDNRGTNATPSNLSMQPRTIPDLNSTTGIKPVPFTVIPSTDDRPPSRPPVQPQRADLPPIRAADPSTDTTRFAQRDDRPGTPIVDADPTRKGATTSGVPPIRNPLAARNDPPPQITRRDTYLSEDNKPADPPQPPMPSMRAGFLVQIGAYRDVNEGTDAWRRTQALAPTLLREVPYALNQVTIPGKGTWLRLQLGPYDDRATAEKLCADLKASRVDCFLVRGESQAVVRPPATRPPDPNPATVDRKPATTKPATTKPTTTTTQPDKPATKPMAKPNNNSAHPATGNPPTSSAPTNGTRTTPSADKQPGLSPSRGLPGLD